MENEKISRDDSRTQEEAKLLTNKERKREEMVHALANTVVY